MILKDKVAVVYGAAGSIGQATARAFAREGARVFLTGHVLEPLESIAADIRASDGNAEAALVDALDEREIDAHLQHVVRTAGRVDVSFNAVAIPDAQVVGEYLVNLDLDRYLRAIDSYATTYFLTARLAARHMLPHRSGVIMTVGALHSRIGIPLVGGYGPAQALKESLTRSLSAEIAEYGIRVVGLRPQGIDGSSTIKEAFEPRAEATGLTWPQFEDVLAARTHTKRLMTLEEVGNVAAFMASDLASGITGTTINMTMGSMDD
jgi:NAD(P)-dependent dehydrogenase (short-subunit alcohol dehydrogenase family)